ncbi:TPM domain-containing protein [Leptospira sp. GIMC2001]|uniref:TPM domain-containing protein n=1 Tax=Leptospira sp. GIMC2001 TaxID=1513297 RepID=UPI00234A5A55|nr:TPM domain-containing protein [Leptospira sp. GIMC2001]WCL50140.1 TPM domain-containing protein [Leptospira sp. GIMC2001]
MKKSIILFTILICSNFLSAKDTPNFTTRVLDEAGILNAETKLAIESLSEDLENRTSAHLILYTTPTLDGEILEEYSIRVAESNGIGQAKKDNGILVIIVTDDRKMRIEVGYGLEGTLTDLYCNRIIQNIFIPNFKLGDYNIGIMQGMIAIRQILDGDAEGNPNLNPEKIEEDILNQRKGDHFREWNRVDEESFIQTLVLLGIFLLIGVLSKVLESKFNWLANTISRIIFGFLATCLSLFFTPKGFILLPFIVYICAIFYSLVFLSEEKNHKKKSDSKAQLAYPIILIAHLILAIAIYIIDEDVTVGISSFITLVLLFITIAIKLNIDGHIQNSYDLVFKKLGFEDRSFSATKGYFFSFLLFCLFIISIICDLSFPTALYLFSLFGLAFFIGFWVKSAKFLIYFAIAYGIWVIAFFTYFYHIFEIVPETIELTTFVISDAIVYYSLFHGYASLILVHRFIPSTSNIVRLLKFSLIALLWTIVPYINTLIQGGEWPNLLIFPINLGIIYFIKFCKVVSESDTGGYSSGGSSYSSSSSSSSSSYSSSSSSSSSGSSYSGGGGSFGGGGSSGSW